MKTDRGGKMHFVIPDVQMKHGIDTAYLRSIGKYLVYKKPDRLICLGDFADMESLSSWDKGKTSFEGRRYAKDVASVKAGMKALLGPLREHNLKQLKRGLPIYRPSMDLFYGNHEDRIRRTLNEDAKLEGLMSLDDLGYESFGWTTHTFLDPRVVDGVVYSHYLTSGVMGRPVGTASALLSKKHMSCVVGHQQGFQIATTSAADGRGLTGIIAGSCYEHDEDYLGPQGNKHWRGFLILHDVRNGEFTTQQISIKHAKRKFT
jgi:hypothetical protein